MMKLRYELGGFIEVNDEERAKRYLQSASWTEIKDEEAPETAADESNDEPEGYDTPEPVADAPALPEPQEQAKPDVATVRAWAKENGIEVSDKGRVAGEVYDKYAEAHKN
jgi:hypothetical protein